MANPSLRLAEIVGQEHLVARLKGFGAFFVSTGGAPGHILLTGEDGMGQSTIARAFASEFNVGFQEVDAAGIEVNGDLTALLTNLKPKQVLLLSNLQLLRRIHAIRLRDALQDGKLEILIGQGPALRRHIFELNPFTVVATCPRKSDCPVELLNEFSLVLSLQPYTRLELQALVDSISMKAGISLEPGASELIAKCCDGRPGHLEPLLKRLTRAINKSTITCEELSQALLALGISVGLEASPNNFDGLMKLSG